MHAAAGILSAVVAVELMPEALSKVSAWTVGIAFGLGGIAEVEAVSASFAIPVLAAAVIAYCAA